MKIGVGNEAVSTTDRLCCFFSFVFSFDDQQFYSNNCWQTAHNSNSLFISPLESLPRTSLKKSFRQTTIHDIGVADLHNYFVSPRPILAHNFLIEAGVVIVFGAGGFEILWTGALTLFGIGVAAAYSASKNEMRKTEVNCTEALSNMAYAAFGPEHAKKAHLEAQNQNSQESQNSQKNSSGGGGAPDPEDPKGYELLIAAFLLDGPAIVNGCKYTKHALERFVPRTQIVLQEFERRAAAMFGKGTQQYLDYMNNIKPRGIPERIISETMKYGTSTRQKDGTCRLVTEAATLIVNKENAIITGWLNKSLK